MAAATVNGRVSGDSGSPATRNIYSDFEEILEKVGQFGKYQIFTCVIIQLSTILWAGNNSFLHLMMLEPDISCTSPDNATDNKAAYVSPGHSDYCQVFSNCSQGRLSTRNDHFFSPVQEWLLICDRAYIRDVILSMCLGGRILGSFFGGHFGDYVGRKTGFFVAQFFILLSSVMSLASMNWITLAVFQCVNGFMFGVIIVTSYALMFEYTSNKYGLIANASFQYCLGYMAVAVVGVLTKDWRYYLIFINLISAPLLVAYLLFLESPRYLIVKGRLHQAADVLTNMASDRWNKKNVEFWEEELANVPRDDTNRFYTFVHLFSTKEMAVQSSMQILSAFTCSLVTSFFTVNFIPAGLFLQFLYFGLFRLWIPLVMIILDFQVSKCGRRHFYFATLGFVGLCFSIVLIALASGINAKSPIIYVVSALGVIVNASGYFMCVLHITAAVYPTVVRCTAFGALQITDDIGTLLGRLEFEKLAAHYWIGWPYSVCLTFIIVNFLLALKFQKETKGRQLADRLEDIKKNIIKDGM